MHRNHGRPKVANLSKVLVDELLPSVEKPSRYLGSELNAVDDTQKDMSKVLEPKHIKYLTSNFTLKRWAGKSLDERASLFSGKFSDKSITGSSLWRLYHKHGIKFKLVAVKKLPSKDKRE